MDQTGTETWQYQESNCREDYAIAPDGTIFLVEDAYQNNNVAMVTALDPITGQVKFNITLPASSQYTSGGGATEGLDPDRPSGLAYCTPGTPGGTFTQTMAIHGSISASSDGNAYIPFTTTTAYGDASGCDPSPDPSYPKFPHLVQPGDGNWSASATLQLMTIHPDGSYSTQQLDANSASGTGMTIGSATGFFTLGRAIPDGQGGTLLTVWSPSMLYHASSSGVSKFALPIFPDEPFGDDLFSADSLLLGEDGTAYIVGSSSEEAPVDTVLAIDSNTGATKWAASPGLHPKLSTVTSDGSVAFQYSLPDFSVHSALASPSGQVSPLFANPNDNSDAGPVLLSDLFGLHLPLYWTLGTWHSSLSDLSLAAITGHNTNLTVSSYPKSQGSRSNTDASPKMQIDSFLPSPITVGENPRFGSTPQVKSDLRSTISTKIATNTIYTDVNPKATVGNFLTEIKKPQDAIAFVGHAIYVTSGNSHIAVGLQFTDNWLMRTNDPLYPNCGFAPLCYEIPSGSVDQPFLQTRASVVFVAACDTNDVFLGWWTIGQGTSGRVLIVPDLTEMARINQSPAIDPQQIGLDQGTVAWEALVNSLAAGNPVRRAFVDANSAVANYYNGLPISARNNNPLAVWTFIGDANVCISSKCKPQN